jgi:hypothetical protein
VGNPTLSVAQLDIMASGDTVGPVGAIRLTRNGSSIQASIDGAAAVPFNTGGLGGGGSAGAALARAQALVGPTVTKVIGSDFDNDQYHVAAVVSTGAVAMSATLRSCINLTSGATASSSAAIKPHGSPICQVANMQTDRWFFQYRAQLTTAVDVQAEVGYEVANNGGNPLAEVGLIGSLSATVFSWRVTVNGGTATTGLSTIAVDTNFHTFEGWNDGTSVFFAIDGVIVGSTVVANIGTNPGQIFSTTANGTTAAARTQNIDHAYVCVAGN